MYLLPGYIICPWTVYRCLPLGQALWQRLLIIYQYLLFPYFVVREP